MIDNWKSRERRELMQWRFALYNAAKSGFFVEGREPQDWLESLARNTAALERLEAAESLLHYLRSRGDAT